MLRTAVCILGGLLAAGGIYLCMTHVWGPGINALGIGIVLIVGAAFERWRYRKELPPQADWQATSERFLDPQTGKSMDVFYDPRSGERRYAESARSQQPHSSETQ